MPLNIKNENPLNKIEIVGDGFDDLGNRYIKLQVTGSKRQLPPYSVAQLLEPKIIYQDLGNAGCLLLSTKEKNGLLKRVQEYQQAGLPSFLVVTRLGSFEKFYVRPDAIVGSPETPVELSLSSLDPQMLAKFRCRGSLSDWQRKIGRLCIGNSRLIFAASLACTGPILRFVKGPRTGGFQLYGPAETGKTTAAMVAGSIWGCHIDSMRKDKGFAETWNTTLNEQEKTAQVHSDTIFIPDETNLAGDDEKTRALAVIKGVFRLSENVQKGRMNQSGSAAWRFYFLCTSNLSFDQLAQRGGIAIDDQHRGRMVDIPLPLNSDAHGIYDELQDYAGGADLTDALKNRCRTVFGTPGLTLVERLYASKASQSEAHAFIAACRKSYIAKLNEKAAGAGMRPLKRATARFATVYAAGCLAIDYGIFKWAPTDVLSAVLSCQLDGLRGDLSGRIEGMDLKGRLVSYLTDNRAQFIDLNQKKPKAGNHQLGSAPGYVQTHGGTDWLYLTTSQLRAIIGNGQAAKLLKKLLVREGLMAKTKDRDLVQRPIFRAKGNEGFRWVHAFRVTLLENSIEAPRRRALNKNK
jgi:putative DNA primase/helicase